MLDNKNIQKVFSLSDFRKKQLLGEIPERTRETYREYGYFGGGFSPATSTVSSVERIDLSNDTVNALVRGPLASGRYSGGATSNNSFGYFGGSGPGPVSSSNRINYSNDTATASVRGNFSIARRYVSAAAGNLNFGYYAGGWVPSSALFLSTVDRIDYSNDLATTSVRGPINDAKAELAATGNSNFGYFGGGRTFAPSPAVTYSRVDRISYSNDLSSASIRGPLSSAKSTIAATGNSNFGYFGGGVGGSNVSTIDRINYSNDLVTASARTNLSQQKASFSATGNSNFGYFGASIVPAPTNLVSSIDRLDYANDTVTTTVRGAFNTPKAYSAATSSASFGGAPNSSFASNFTFPTVPNAGYFGGGFDGTNNLATIDKVDYANDTSTASVRSALSSAKRGTAGTGNSNFGYFGGGVPEPGASNTSTIDRIEYASDTQNTVTRGPLSLARGNLTATGTSNFGYFGGGSTPDGAFSTVDRINYSNDSATTSVRGPLSIARLGLSSTGNQNFGYFGGGTIPGGSPTYSQIDRIDYSNDTSTASSKSNLTLGRFYLSATGTQNFGYFGGGSLSPSGSPSNWRSTINRIEYSNDTQTTVVRGPLNSPIKELSATGNSNFGYFGGGDGPLSSVNRLDYSNDTAVTSIRGPLSTAKRLLVATSPLAYGGAPIYFTNPLPEVLQKQIEFNDSNTLDLPFKRVLGSFGYFGGGFVSPNVVSTVDRIDYSNDTSTTSVRGPLSFERFNSGSVGNINFGYFGGGTIPGGGTIYSTIHRIDYSNDSSTTSTRGQLRVTKYSMGSTGNNNFGYYAAGIPVVSTIERIDYSNDNATSLAKGTLTLARYQLAASGNFNFGYFGGGVILTPASVSIIDRINYSNDTATASVRGPLNLARHQLAASGNSNFGYFAGGTPGPISTVNRIDYSNDTATASVRGPLSSAKRYLAATGNSNFGYYGCGFTSTSVSTVDRIDYSNDTQTASVRGPLSSIRIGLTATTNARSS